MIGGTKYAEYQRTIDMLQDMTGKSRKDVMFILYFLYDSQYGNSDLKEMAEIIKKELKIKGLL